MDDLIAELERLHREATPGEWSLPHFADESSGCNCRYVLADGYFGSVFEVSVGNGKLVGDGGNDAPPLPQAKANAALIVTLRNALPRLIATLKAAEAMRAEIAEYACLGIDKCPKYGTTNECERRMMALECGDDARKAIAAYDAAKAQP